MSRQMFGGPTLPRALLDQVGDQGPRKKREGFDRRRPFTRKDQRREERTGKKAARQSLRRIAEPQRPRSKITSRVDKDEPDGGSGSEHQVPERPTRIAEAVNVAEKSGSVDHSGSKRKRMDDDARSLSQPQRKSRKESEDDEEIAALEKKLGVRTKKLPKSFDEEGLGGLLGDLDGSDAETPPHHKGVEDDAWLRHKRRRSAQGIDDGQQLGALDVDTSDEVNFESDDDEALQDGFEADADEVQLIPNHPIALNSQAKPVSRKRENPYVAPVTESQSTEKYVPPSLRKLATSDVETTAQIRRQLQGLLNKLSEANMLSILSEVEKLYTNNARQFVHATLVDLLIGLVADVSALNDTFLILHAGFVAGVYKLVGSDFGAQLLERLVERFDQHYTADEENEGEGGKETGNLISLLSQLYNLQMVNSAIVFDYVRLFLSSISERHTELLLRIIRASGSQLRQDDATAIKDIAQSLQTSVTAAANQNVPVSVRTRFMVETITSLKDNRMKQGVANSALMSEHLIRMKKTLGSMNTRSLKANEPLSISLVDIRNSDKRGKWWLIGASWRGPGIATQPVSSAGLDHEARTTDAALPDDSGDELPETRDAADIPLAELATQNRMNTPLRRAIFTTLLSATDVQDAHTRLLKLDLTHKQELEIPRVLLHCVGAEAGVSIDATGYNPYYELVAQRTCESCGKQTRTAFVYGLWDLLRRMGGKNASSSNAYGDDDNDYNDDEQVSGSKGKLSTTVMAHYARFYARLLLTNTLPVSMLKPLDFARLAADKKRKTTKDRTGLFAEVLLVTVISRVSTAGKAIRDGEKQDRQADTRLWKIFREAREVEGLAQGLSLFLSKVIAKSDLVTKKAKRQVRSSTEDLASRLSTGAVL